MIDGSGYTIVDWLSAGLAIYSGYTKCPECSYGQRFAHC